MNVQYVRMTYDIGHQMEVYVHIERNHIITKLSLVFERENNKLTLLPDVEWLNKLNIHPDELEQTVLAYLKR